MKLRIPFSTRAQDMNFMEAILYKGFYQHIDEYSEVIYRQLTTIPGGENHATDGQLVPLYAIFTRRTQEEDYQYKGIVSDYYKFVGNNMLVNNIRQSINEVGLPILTENPILNYDYTSFRNEMIIQSSKETAESGDIFPVIIVDNSYNGTKAQSISFGISTYHNNERILFAFDLGKMRQVHIENANTEVSSTVSSYMEVFANDIQEMITNCFNSTLSEDDMLGTLDLIEKIGKRKRNDISKFLDDMMPDVPEGSPPPLPSVWQMFLAIVRYSSLEPNLNIKRLLENAAESVLIIPPRMINVLEQL